MAYRTRGDNVIALILLNVASSVLEVALEALDEDGAHTETYYEEDSEHPVLDGFYEEG